MYRWVTLIKEQNYTKNDIKSVLRKYIFFNEEPESFQSVDSKQEKLINEYKKELPKLKNTESAISLLKDEPDITSLYHAIHHIIELDSPCLDIL